MGPILIFDKSTLESLNPDETVWLDQFFLVNITPLFFVETLADLEKEVKKGRTPEHVVGSLAYKTPDLDSCSNTHHGSLLASELEGAGEVDMRFGRPIVSGGQTVELDGKMGVIYQPPPEAEALDRWRRGEFMDLERLFAKAWRQALSGINFEQLYQSTQHNFRSGVKPKTLAEVKSLVDPMIDMPNQEQVLVLGLVSVGASQRAQERVLTRWRAVGQPPVREFAPYFAHVLTVNLFVDLAIASDLISRERPSHTIDIAYLYYLPFCTVFTSNDHLHESIVPLFLKPHQSFVRGVDLKADLARLDQLFSALPEEVRKKGVYHFAAYPPPDSSFLATRLWDKHMSPTWRESEAKPKRVGNEKIDPEVLKGLSRLEKEGVPVDSSRRINSDDVDSMLMKRTVRARKGKWMRFPPEVIEATRREE